MTEAQANRRKQKRVLAAFIAGAVAVTCIKYSQFTAGHATKTDVITGVVVGIVAFV